MFICRFSRTRFQFFKRDVIFFLYIHNALASLVTTPHLPTMGNGLGMDHPMSPGPALYNDKFLGGIFENIVYV